MAKEKKTLMTAVELEPPGFEPGPREFGTPNPLRHGAATRGELLIYIL